MKHWDESEVVNVRADARPVRLSRAERKRVRVMFAQVPAHRRQNETPHIGSMIGVALALAVLAGLAWAIAPADPVSPKLLP